MTDKSALIKEGLALAEDCNQLPTARVWAREAVAALGEMERGNRELLYNYEKQVESNRRINLKRRVLAEGFAAAVRRLDSIASMDVYSKRDVKPSISPEDYYADIAAIRQALAILNPTPKAPQNERGRDGGVSVEVGK